MIIGVKILSVTTPYRSFSVEEILKKVCDYAILGMMAAMGWFFKSLQTKADKSEIDLLRNEVSQLREHVFQNLATKNDLNKLEIKIDKLIDRELGKKR